MHAFGGLYIDLDVQCFRSVEDSLLGHDIVLQSEYRGGRDIVNSIMASVPGHPFWKAIITQMLEVHSYGRPLPHASCICGLQADFMRVHTEVCPPSMIMSFCAGLNGAGMLLLRSLCVPTEVAPCAWPCGHGCGPGLGRASPVQRHLPEVHGRQPEDACLCGRSPGTQPALKAPSCCNERAVLARSYHVLEVLPDRK